NVGLPADAADAPHAADHRDADHDALRHVLGARHDCGEEEKKNDRAAGGDAHAVRGTDGTPVAFQTKCGLTARRATTIIFSTLLSDSRFRSAVSGARRSRARTVA